MSESQVITAREMKAAESERRSLLATFAERYGLEPNNMMRTLKATAFRQRDGEISNEQMAALLIVANTHALNPFTKEIHAFAGKGGGIVPIVGVDGWAKLVNEHPQFDGMTFEQDDDKCTCTMYRKDRSHPIVVTEYMIECKQSTGPWQTHPKRMLRHKAMIQCARLAFSLAGIYDPDEGEQILAGEEIDVTPDPEKLSPQKLREVAEGLLAAVKENNGSALWTIWNSMTSGQQLYLWGTLRSYERSAIKKLQESAKWAKDGLDLEAWSVQAIRGARDQEALATIWRSVQDVFAETDATVPLDVNTVYEDRKSELGE